MPTEPSSSEYHTTRVVSVSEHGACIEIDDPFGPGARTDLSWDVLQDAAAQRDPGLARHYQAMYDAARKMRDAQAVAWRIVVASTEDGEIIGPVYPLPCTDEAARALFDRWRAYDHNVRSYRVELLWPEDLERETAAESAAIQLGREIDAAGAELVREGKHPRRTP